MGSLISVDREVTQLDDLINVTLGSFRPSKASAAHSHHIKLWRFQEDSSNSDMIQSHAVNLTEPQSFKNKECYLVLIVYHKDSEMKFNGYPHSIWGMIESLGNLTPRGLENVFTSDDSASLDTFLLARRQQEESNIHYMLFVWNGKNAGALLKAYALTKGFELDFQLSKGKSQILQGIFTGLAVKSKIAQIGQVVTIESAFQYDSNTNKKPDCSVYLLQWLWPEIPKESQKPLFPKFTEMFLSLRESKSQVRLPEDKPVPKLNIAIKEKGFEKVFEKETKEEKGFERAAKEEKVVEKLEMKPKMNMLTFAGLKTREEDRVKLEGMTKSQMDDLEDNFDVRDTNRKEMKLKYYSEVLSELDPSLYVGSDLVARDLNKLKEYGITHVINCAANVCLNYFPSDFTYLHYFLKDARTESIDCVFYQVIEFITNAIKSGGKVLVHCMQGVSRSVTVCLAYIIFKRKQSFEQVFANAKNTRGICSPNIGFQVQLIWWYKRLCEDYESVPVTPRVFAIGSHQKEQPNTIVARLLTQPLYFGADYFTLDSRGVFLIQSKSVTYLWLGNSIATCNKEKYLQVAHKHFELLCRYEKANELVEITEGKEPDHFWTLWKDDRKGSGSVDLWDAWYPRLDLAVDEEPQEIEQNTEEEVVDMKPKLYIFPETVGIGVFEDEELVDDAFICLCTSGKCFKWKGFDVDLSEDEENSYVTAVMQDYYAGSADVVVDEEPGSETDDFLNYF